MKQNKNASRKCPFNIYIDENKDYRVENLPLFNATQTNQLETGRSRSALLVPKATSIKDEPTKFSHAARPQELNAIPMQIDLSDQWIQEHLTDSQFPNHHQSLSSVFNSVHTGAPFQNHEILQESYQHVTRFMSFASVGNKEKQKWMHAFGSKPLKSMKREELVAQPPQTSEFPNKDILAEAFERKEGA
ncbi:hypothetical protein QR680_009301 [Steinernema hermaphroditum]|uniref:Uncharacterized protein n=1 Tax=Steinernema hermaphroditum TaxID=289476 RepID=A0AA39IJS9_9BILA|nr:hypothetical protein QR680_009301 [Steinernema hermaphroditum]